MMYHILVFYTFILLLPVSDGKNYHLYQSNLFINEAGDRDCLDYYVLNDIVDYGGQQFYSQTHQIIPFCYRPDNDSYDIENFFISTARPISFGELKKSNITSAQVYSWSVPMEIVELYQAYLELNVENADKNNKIYNCSETKTFGHVCQYSFKDKQSLEYTVLKTMKDFTIPYSSTCYQYLKCPRSIYSPSWCLDWREICDGKIDCWDGEDERNCWLLELNMCREDEYRCRNGQCIPEGFLLDDRLNPECLDGSDELTLISVNTDGYPERCSAGDLSMRCEDTSCGYWHIRCGVDKGCKLSGSCREIHSNKFVHSILSRPANQHVNERCWSAMVCLLEGSDLYIGDPSFIRLFNETCSYSTWDRHVKDHCPETFIFPAEPIALGYIRFIYSWNHTEKEILKSKSRNVCYNKDLCGGLLPSTFALEELCQYTLTLHAPLTNWRQWILYSTEYFSSACVPLINANTPCPAATHFRCGNRCLSKNRRTDLFQDCYDDSDELAFSGPCEHKKKHRVTCTVIRKDNSTRTRCLPIVIKLTSDQENGQQVCLEDIDSLPSFTMLCDGFLQYEPAVTNVPHGFDPRRDETDCDEWQCDNQYTRYDGTWNCLNGIDEAHCGQSNCSVNEHPCLSVNPSTEGEFFCLPIARAGDGIIDCIGGTDERLICRGLHSDNQEVGLRFLCQRNDTDFNNSLSTKYPIDQCIGLNKICNGVPDCKNKGDDERAWLCSNDKPFWNWNCDPYISGWSHILTGTSILCRLSEGLRANILMVKYPPFFSLANRSIHPPSPFRSQTSSNIRRSLSPKNAIGASTYSNIIKSDSVFYCHGGIMVSVSNKINRCLCPPSLYGSHCEYQNQRVSLTLQVGAIEWRSPFRIFIILVDQTTETVQSYDHITYLSMRDCHHKYNINLLYLSRPKATNHTYYVRIEVFEAINLQYRASWFYSIDFPFLPVYRLAIQLTMFSHQSSLINRCALKCGSHGHCSVYSNTGTHFCRCDSGWKGVFCNQLYTCNCSVGSVCIGSWKNQSICVCPLHKYGPRCFLTNTICFDAPCANNSWCIPRDVRVSVGPDKTCVCFDGFRGELCEEAETRLIMNFSSFEHFVEDSILLHFITVHSRINETSNEALEWGPHERATTFQKIPVNQQSIQFYWPNPFHLLFAQIDSNFYLLLLQVTYYASSTHEIHLDEKQLCPSLRVLNSTIFIMKPIRRMKRYHVPCQEQLQLSCFHDEDEFICLCTQDHRANCFTFDHQMKYNCREFSNCENDGQCFQDNATCPTSSKCACPRCFFGSRCQLSTKGFAPSLDAILGYRIQPRIKFMNQSTELKVSSAITILIFIIGLINGTLTLLTFRAKNLYCVGSGFYLLVVSIVILIAICIFAFKFICLVVSQMNLISSGIFLTSQCVVVDFLLRVLLQTGDWLYASVAVERALAAIKGVQFNKKKSKQLARWIVLGIFIFTCTTNLQEPLYRTIVEDEEEQRRWCVISYPRTLNVFLTRYTSIIAIIHFTGPFMVNTVSSLLIIIATARYRFKAQKDDTFMQQLRKQLYRHKHLIISPCGLIIVALPRVILAFELDCIKSARDPVGLFLTGYFISFVPLLMTFIVFVVPSQTYMNEFRTQAQNLRNWIKK